VTATGPARRPGAPRRIPGAGRPARLDPDELAALEEQRDFLLGSLDDLEREHRAGDLDDDDHRTLRDDYTARAAETIRAIEAQRAAFAGARRRPDGRRTAAVVTALVAFAVVAGALVASSLGARQAGDTITGEIGVRQSPSQRAQGCQELIDPAAPQSAIDCYQGVLDDDSRNVVAKTFLAWQLELSSGFQEAGDAELLQRSAADLIEQAIEDDPDYSYARAFRAVMAFRHGEPERAQQYLEEFRDANPSADARAVIDQMELEGRIAEALADQSGPRDADEADRVGP
jgi:tetratricopeptide (TPR) repeat protein